MTIRPVMFDWTDDEVMVPQPRFLALCIKQFVIGESYPLMIVENRSMKSHRHYFAAVHQAWLNLPENVAYFYPTIRTQTDEHMRKWALVQVGYAVEEFIDFDTPQDAKRAATAMRRRDDFAIITVRGTTVRVFTAKSQSVPAMKKEEFQDSKKKVLDFLEDVISVARGALAKNAGNVA